MAPIFFSRCSENAEVKISLAAGTTSVYTSSTVRFVPCLLVKKAFYYLPVYLFVLLYCPSSKELRVMCLFSRFCNLANCRSSAICWVIGRSLISEQPQDLRPWGLCTFHRPAMLNVANSERCWTEFCGTRQKLGPDSLSGPWPTVWEMLG